jgi:hypothetical protein
MQSKTRLRYYGVAWGRTASVVIRLYYMTA